MCGALRVILGVGKALGIQGAGARLHQHKTERDHDLRISTGKIHRLPVRFFGLVPALLIGKDITEPVRCAEISRLHVKSQPIRCLSERELARIAGVVAVRERVFVSFFDFGRSQSHGFGLGPQRDSAGRETVPEHLVLLLRAQGRGKSQSKNREQD